jgi:hypothetical protein
MATNLVQIDNDEEIKQRLEAERSRLRKIAGLDGPRIFTAGRTGLYRQTTESSHHSVWWFYMEA